jgi:heat shock protein HslJ
MRPHVLPLPITRAIVVIALSALALACAPIADDNANRGLVNTSWTVASVAGVPTNGNARPTMTFAADGTVNGNTGCNQYSGVFRTDGSAISITKVVSTMMMCAGDGGQVEAVFLKGLNGAATWRQTGAGQLEIDGVLPIVAGPGVAEGPPDDAPAGLEIPGSSWILTEMGGTADLAHIDPTLVFGSDGTVSGFAGCNTFSGTYTPDGHIGSLMSTEIGCKPPASIIESDYLKALSDVGRWALVDGRLDSDGAIPLTFEPG